MIYLYLIKEEKSFSVVNVQIAVGHNVFNLDYAMVLIWFWTETLLTIMQQDNILKLKIKYRTDPNVNLVD